MAIYKLGDVCEIISGSKLLNNKTGNINVIGSGGVFGTTTKAKYSKPSISLPRKGTMELFWYDQPVWNVDTAFLIGDVNEVVLVKKYLYYYLLNKKKWSHMVNGSTRPATRITDWRKLAINIPKFDKQQKIIDIIELHEKLFLKYSNCVRIDNSKNAKTDIKNLIDIIKPLEEINNSLLSLKEKIDTIAKRTLDNLPATGKFTRKAFIKGRLLVKKEGKTPFLNVSAANNKINRYVGEEPNIFIGDVTLSLDGNLGLVNNSLHGFNGYLYKIDPKICEEYISYFSLLSKMNQRIIKMNETGTTIKHSPKSKDNLVILDVPKYMKSLFEMDVTIKKVLTKIENLKSNLLKLLIK